MKNRIIFIIAGILLTATAIMVIYNQTTTIKRELRDFAVPDTANVDKIFMTDKLNQTVLLERKGGDWTVNGKCTARKDAVYILLKTIARLDIKSPVPRSMLNTVISQMAARNVKVEIYKNSELFKVYYVGGPTADEQGTFMMLENSSSPFIVHIPGFSGYLSTRYFVDEFLWRDQGIFRTAFRDISSVQVDYPQESVKSFIVKNEGPNTFTVLSNGKALPAAVDTDATKQYLGRFSNICFESIIMNFDPHRKDSISKAIPFAIVTLSSRDGKSRKLTLWRMLNLEKIMQYDGSVPRYNLDAMYGRIDNEDVYLTVQYYVMDPILKEPSFFIYKNIN